MSGVNKVILLGHLGKDPEVRALDNGRKVGRFTLATTESYKNQQGERVNQTEWHNVVFWGPVVDVVEQYLKKGSQVYVEGKITNRSYDDKDGVKKYVTEIVGQTLTLLGSNNGNGSGNNSSSSDDRTSEARTSADNYMHKNSNGGSTATSAPAQKPATTTTTSNYNSSNYDDDLPF